jgi:hypothetical protein
MERLTGVFVDRVGDCFPVGPLYPMAGSFQRQQQGLRAGRPVTRHIDEHLAFLLDVSLSGRSR